MSQLFWPDRGLQVPHFGGGVGFAKVRVAAARVTSKVTTENCIANVDRREVKQGIASFESWGFGDWKSELVGGW